MSWANPVRLTARVPGTFRGRCDCLFWIIVEHQIDRLRCPVCGARVRRATRVDYDNHGVVDVVQADSGNTGTKRART